ncbi:hypothetical protein J7I98_22145 [Streptomyces sp. ISL-98]|uniref:hypothetical protein n=1 Tax=Streptomyces sp. ISL-98 TaxID=2819192 RepID=UPI001BE528A2|nr:hypothetical protein [Streptomyces sp. ISL-98]MBT2508540.1 hypothetical protein [Streptomyces sp. ISL-98]
MSAVFLSFRGLETGCQTELDALPVLRFFGRYESEALLQAAQWCKDHVDGQDVVVTSTWFRHIDEEVEDGLNYEFGLAVEVI